MRPIVEGAGIASPVSAPQPLPFCSATAKLEDVCTGEYSALVEVLLGDQRVLVSDLKDLTETDVVVLADQRGGLGELARLWVHEKQLWPFLKGEHAGAGAMRSDFPSQKCLLTRSCPICAQGGMPSVICAIVRSQSASIFLSCDLGSFTEQSLKELAKDLDGPYDHG